MLIKLLKVELTIFFLYIRGWDQEAWSPIVNCGCVGTRSACPHCGNNFSARICSFGSCPFTFLDLLFLIGTATAVLAIHLMNVFFHRQI